MVIAAVCQPLATSCPKIDRRPAFVVKVKRLRIEFPGKRNNLVPLDQDAAGRA